MEIMNTLSLSSSPPPFYSSPSPSPSLLFSSLIIHSSKGHCRESYLTESLGHSLGSSSSPLPQPSVTLNVATPIRAHTAVDRHNRHPTVEYRGYVWCTDSSVQLSGWTALGTHVFYDYSGVREVLDLRGSLWDKK